MSGPGRHHTLSACRGCGYSRIPGSVHTATPLSCMAWHFEPSPSRRCKGAFAPFGHAGRRCRRTLRPVETPRTRCDRVPQTMGGGGAPSALPPTTTMAMLDDLHRRHPPLRPRRAVGEHTAQTGPRLRPLVRRPEGSLPLPCPPDWRVPALRVARPHRRRPAGGARITIRRSKDRPDLRRADHRHPARRAHPPHRGAAGMARRTGITEGPLFPPGPQRRPCATHHHVGRRGGWAIKRRAKAAGLDPSCPLGTAFAPAS